MGTTIVFRRGNTFPSQGSGITLAEPVFNTSQNTFHIGLGHGVTAEWVGAPITGLSASIASGEAYKIPTAAAVKNYVTDYVTAVNGVLTVNGFAGGVTLSAGTGVSVAASSGTITITNTGVQSFNGFTGAVRGVSSLNGYSGGITLGEGTGIQIISTASGITFINGWGSIDDGAIDDGRVIAYDGNSNTHYYTTSVASFNGNYGAVQGVSAAVAGTGISVSGATGAVTITNTGVQSFNGLTGAVTGVTVGGANTFTALQSFSAGISATGATFSSTANTLDVIASTEGAGLRIARATSGAGSRIGGIRLGRSTTTNLNTYIEGSSGTFSLYNGVDNTGTVFATFSPTQFSLGTTSASFITLNSPNLISFGDQSAVGNNQVFSISGTARTYTFGDSTGVTTGFVGINRLGLCGDYALEVNSPTGKGLQLIYNDHTGAASNWVNMDVSSGGNFTVRPSGGLATVTGTLNVSAGVCAAGATFSGNISAPNIVTSFNGVTGAVTGVSRVNGLSGGITLAAGTGITFTTSGNTITLASTASGSANSTTQTIDFSDTINQIEVVMYGIGVDFFTSLKYSENWTVNSVTFDTGTTAGYSAVFERINSFYDPTNGWSARLVIKPPFTLGTSTTAEGVIGETINTVYIDATNGATSIVDYWSSIQSQTLLHKEATYRVKTVTGQTWVTPDSFITCKVLGLTTGDHIPEDASLEGVRFEIDNIVAGTGFDIIGHAPEGTYGKYSVKCLGQ